MLIEFNYFRRKPFLVHHLSIEREIKFEKYLAAFLLIFKNFSSCFQWPFHIYQFVRLSRSLCTSSNLSWIKFSIVDPAGEKPSRGWSKNWDVEIRQIPEYVNDVREQRHTN